MFKCEHLCWLHVLKGNYPHKGHCALYFHPEVKGKVESSSAVCFWSLRKQCTTCHMDNWGPRRCFCWELELCPMSPKTNNRLPILSLTHLKACSNLLLGKGIPWALVGCSTLLVGHNIATTGGTRVGALMAAWPSPANPAADSQPFLRQPRRCSSWSLASLDASHGQYSREVLGWHVVPACSRSLKIWAKSCGVTAFGAFRAH